MELVRAIIAALFISPEHHRKFRRRLQLPILFALKMRGIGACESPIENAFVLFIASAMRRRVAIL